MLKVIIVEDEKHSREALKNLLTEFCEGLEIIGMAGSVTEAVSLIRENQPDLVFLDIELQPGTGFDVLEKSRDIPFEIVFTTAYEQYAIKAIKFSSIDYLLKPVDIEELQGAVNKAKLRKDKQSYQRQLETLLTNMNATPGQDQNICLATAEGIEFVKVSDIIYCEASGSYTKFYFTNGQSILVSKNLKEYETLLENHRFMRVHNSFLINLKEVKRYVKSDGGYILMNNNETISISPKKKELFLVEMGR